MSPLTDAEIHALNEALDDEHRAWATYDQVIADFGEEQPPYRCASCLVRALSLARARKSLAWKSRAIPQPAGSMQSWRGR
jgi:hypothetical protein